eukprot:TRINITY_DN6543_c0_g1_i4.p1 TRINITY_DN6543_c0_g1~~TRINITY_DN6543_c0_g1_i4.p1  ORF type:complete len:433 (-),score=67.50 TRINITY_DN6543_c0_g1_i4:242-1540(-)
MESSKVNIPSYIEDINYRYQMPKIQFKIEGKGNGIRTNVINMFDIAKALRVNTDYPLKFMGIELGSQIYYKERGNDVTTIINGQFQEKDLIRTLDKFIDKYVLCPGCKQPEMLLRIKNKMVCGKCDGCGNRPVLDNGHSLAKYIIKNPPKTTGILDKNAQSEEKKDIKRQAKPQPVQSQTKQHVTSEAKLKPDQLKKYAEAQRESYQQNFKFDKDNQIVDFDKSLQQYIQDLYQQNIDQSLTDKKFFILFNSMFTINIAHEIKQNARILSEIIRRLDVKNSNQEIMMNLQYFLLEQNKSQDYSQYIATILKLFYDEDLLEEEYLLKWNLESQVKKNHFLYDEERNRKFINESAQFIKWLQAVSYTHLTLPTICSVQISVVAVSLKKKKKKKSKKVIILYYNNIMYIYHQYQFSYIELYNYQLLTSLIHLLLH